MVVLVTGSSRGIGKSLIIEYAKRGLDVIINYHNNDDDALKLQKYIESKYDVKSLVVKCDVSDEEQVEAMFNTINDEFGKLDILINNCGICRDSLFNEIKVRDFKRILDVNLVGTYLCSKYVGRVMLEQKKGKIINISSTNAIDTYYPESCDYDASKAGVISLTHNLAREFAPYINVNCICPGWIKTDMNKDLSLDQINKEKRKILLSRFGEVEDISNLVLFLVSNKASYINDTVIRVDGGKYN